MVFYQEDSTNQQISDELGDAGISPLAYLLSLVEQQKQGNAGTLRTDGYANLIIVEVEDSVWGVGVRWSSGDGYWDVEADPLAYPYDWDAGDQVVSCDS